MIGPSRGHWLAIAAALVVGAAVAASVILNPPAEARKRKFDDIRVQDLSMIRNWIDIYWNEHNKLLPPDLPTLAKNDASSLQREHDPETGVPYTYEITNNNTYKICAVFSLAADNDRYCCAPGDIGHHDAGKFCYSLAVR